MSTPAMIPQTDAVAQVDCPMVKKKFTLAEIVKSPNLAKHLSSDELNAFGTWVTTNYHRDLSTRTDWEQRNDAGIKMALQYAEEKSFPWTNCSNVKFPLVTIAALQFLARISILTKGRNLVKFEAIGADVDGKKAAQAKRISMHMSTQLTDDDICWVDEDEKCKFAASIVGSAVKKSYYDPVSGMNVSEYVPAKNLVVDYYCKHLDTAHRATHLMPMSPNKIQERVRRGLFLKTTDTPQAGQNSNNLLQQTADDVQGTRNSGSAEEFEILEQHCWIDLDHDGYAEPYIVSVRKDTGQLLRIVARFLDAGDVHRVNDLAVMQLEDQAKETTDLKEKSNLEKRAQALIDAPDNHIVRIEPTKYFTKYTFVPSPDGGWYGLGLGALLGPVNAATDSVLNQLVDAGTMANTAGGFLGRGVKLKSGKTSFDPFEWKPVDSTGDDLKKNIFPLPVRDPSSVLFQLLGLLISYGEKVGSATDIMTGVSPGQNTPAETSRNTVEQGMMLFSGIYARMYRSFREELLKLYTLNRLFLKQSPHYFDLAKGKDAIIAPDDYSSNRFRIFPSADPSAVSGQQKKDKASALLQWANSTPGVNKYLVNKAWLEACEFSDIDLIYPDPAGPNAIAPPPNPKEEIEKAKLQQKQQEHQDHMSLAVAELKSKLALDEAHVAELEAKAELEASQAEGIDTGHEIALLDVQIGQARQRAEATRSAVDQLIKIHQGQMSHKREVTKIALDAHRQDNADSAARVANTAGAGDEGAMNGNNSAG